MGERHLRARGLAFADDGFVRSSLVDCLHILAELKCALKEDLAHPSCLFLGKARTAVTERDWQSWFCQFLGVPIPALGPLWKEQRVCACGRHVIDEYGDHVH